MRKILARGLFVVAFVAFKCAMRVAGQPVVFLGARPALRLVATAPLLTGKPDARKN